MNILFLGDIFGNPGRLCVSKQLTNLIEKYDVNVVIANGENAAGGIGINPNICDTLLKLGIDVITSGNHIYKKREIYDYINAEPRLLKPINYPPGTPGNGFYVFATQRTKWKKVAVVSVCGRVFIDNLDCPFRAMEEVLKIISDQTPIIVIDMHAEVTSEKMAMGWFLDGRVSAVIGTHTHVQTADERILPKGTAYISDAGMVGPRDSVIGVRKELVIERFINLLPQKFIVASDDNWISGVIIEIDDETGKSNKIERLNLKVDVS